MEPWIDHVNVSAVYVPFFFLVLCPSLLLRTRVWAGLQGQEAGNSLVDILWGAVNPSARLPYTIAKSEADYGSKVLYNSNGSPTQINYSEG